MTFRRFDFSRSAFTLIELMVAISVLIALMGIVSMVFSSASKASGQAQSTTALYRVVEQVTENIRQDLEAMEPSSSILGIARVDILAYKNTTDVESGRTLITDADDPDNDWHRADVLMIVNKRQFAPYVFQADESDDFEQYRHVIYEHANFARLNKMANTSWVTGSDKLLEPSDPSDPSPILASSKWHLARRVVGSPTQQTLNETSSPQPFPTRTNNRYGWPLTDSRFTGETSNSYFYADVFADAGATPQRTLSTLLDNPAYQIASGITQYDSTGAIQFLYHCDPNGYVYRWDATTNTLYCLAPDGASPAIADTRLYWWALTNQAEPRWERTTTSGTRIWYPTSTPPPPVAPPPSSLSETPNNTANDPHNWLEWFYRPGQQGADRVWIDPNPPVGRTDRMAAYFLPGCSDFKIEFTYDDPREIAIDETTREPILTPDYDIDAKGRMDLTNDGTLTTDDDIPTPTPQPIKWQSLPPPPAVTGVSVPSWEQVRVWNRLGVDSTDYGEASKDTLGIYRDLRDLTQTYRWPRAIRITLRVWDPAGRLDEPITQTIVHTFK